MALQSGVPWYHYLVSNFGRSGASPGQAANSGDVGGVTGFDTATGIAPDAPDAMMSVGSPEASFAPAPGPMSTTPNLQAGMGQPSAATAAPASAAPSIGQYVGLAKGLYDVFSGKGLEDQANKIGSQMEDQGVAASDVPKIDSSASNERQIGRQAGQFASNFIPVAGPIVSAGLGTFNSELDKKNASDFMGQLANVGQDEGLQREIGIESTDQSNADKNKDIFRHANQAAGGVLATIYGGPIGTVASSALTAGIEGVKGSREKHRVEKIAERNQRKTENYAADQATLANEEAKQEKGAQSPGETSNIPPMLQALLMAKAKQQAAGGGAPQMAGPAGPAPGQQRPPWTSMMGVG